jgi:hypothetical protein
MLAKLIYYGSLSLLLAGAALTAFSVYKYRAIKAVKVERIMVVYE